MKTAIYAPGDDSLNFPSAVRQLGNRLAAWRSTVQAKARPIEVSASTGVLDKGRTLWVAEPMAREVHCAEGTLWLTFDGVRKDIILEAGQSYRCDCASRLGIHALDAARFEMT